MSDRPLLEMCQISKTFGGVKALSNISLNVAAGEVHALMGENGAGKSTLMKILSGALSPDSGGRISVAGSALPTGNTRASRNYGIAVIYQELSLAPNLTAAQNIFLGAEKAKAGMLKNSLMHKSAQLILERLEVDFDAGVQVNRLSLGQRQMVEIARALSTNARIIVMDEPTTSLSGKETEKLFDVIESLKSEGIAIIYISHRMDEVYRLSDRCSVLRDGAYVGTLDKADVNAEKLVSMMVGRDISSFYQKVHHAFGEKKDVVLRVEELADKGKVKGCSFEVCRGEVLGIAGLVGSGRTELLRLIYGADYIARGRIIIDGQVVNPKSPREALEKGIVYLTEDRKGLGLFLDMSISENVNIAVAEKDAYPGGVRQFRMATLRAKRAIDHFAIRTSSIRQKVSTLSGGNQQKVLFARLLEVNPKILLLDEPTRGVDVGAKSEIYRLIDELAEHGLAVVVVSSELPEIIGIADRCIVMREGEIAGEVASSPDKVMTQEELMTFATGAGYSSSTKMEVFQDKETMA
ncbi:sugar ABC transporter ATP-binding protein [Kushneria aurantia]|uniref:Sugar ABC transporter ATP-binding protein n=1 Tax=Kushneria aurantia TaxID=504092 RepID=A0ABV6G5L5_9GAMM|nr:sugar ABC transporter ATP-binding protein [Kushneria aurantia]